MKKKLKNNYKNMIMIIKITTKKTKNKPLIKIYIKIISWILM